MDNLDKSSCAFALDGTCRLPPSACPTCKCDKATSDFHKTIVIGGYTWQDICALQANIDRSPRRSAHSLSL